MYIVHCPFFTICKTWLIPRSAVTRIITLIITMIIIILCILKTKKNLFFQVVIMRLFHQAHN